MAKRTAARFDVCVADWIASLDLSSAAVKAYVGEVKRLSEYCASKKVFDLPSLREMHWVDYVHSLTRERDYLSPPRGALKPASTVQAIRITRAFLCFCHRNNLTGWSPDGVRVRAPSRTVQTPTTKLSALGRKVVTGSAEGLTEKQARLHFVVALSFWGGLTPQELSRLRVRDHRVEQARMHVTRRVQPIELPSPVAELWKRYEAHRSQRSPVKPASPLIGGLRSNGPVSAWTIWAMLKDAEAAFGIGCRLWRAAYANHSRLNADRDIELVRRQMGKPARADQAMARASVQREIRRLNDRTLAALRGQAMRIA